MQKRLNISLRTRVGRTIEQENVAKSYQETPNPLPLLGSRYFKVACIFAHESVSKKRELLFLLSFVHILILSKAETQRRKLVAERMISSKTHEEAP